MDDSITKGDTGFLLIVATVTVSRPCHGEPEQPSFFRCGTFLVRDDALFCSRIAQVTPFKAPGTVHRRENKRAVARLVVVARSRPAFHSDVDLFACPDAHIRCTSPSHTMVEWIVLLMPCVMEEAAARINNEAEVVQKSEIASQPMPFHGRSSFTKVQTYL